MAKVSTDPQLIKRVLERGVEAVYPSKEYLKKQLESGKRLTIYLGIDPTSPNLHLGNAVQLIKLGHFQDLGHKVILLIGDFTAMSGDPDKTEVRQRLTKKKIQQNMKSYKKQAQALLKLTGLRFTGSNVAEYQMNSKWLSKMGFEDVVDLASKVTVQRMLERDLFEKRIKSGKPLYIHEFMYPLMQGYDSVAMDVDGEVGGSDQTFNMLTGRDLMKQYKKKEKFVVTVKLLEDSEGKKMGKTTGNMLSLHELPKQMFGKIMSWTDGMIVPAFELLTDLEMDKIQKYEKDMKSGTVNPRDVKVELAKVIVAMYHSKKDADDAEKEFVETFKKKEVPENIPQIKIKEKMTIVEAMVLAKLTDSKSSAKRLVEQGGARLNNEKVTDWKREIEFKSGDTLQAGKRKFARVK